MSSAGRPALPITPDDDLTVAQRFIALWDALADVLGTAATATLLHRALKRADSQTELDGLTIHRDRLSYQYALPESWYAAREGPPLAALTAVIDALRPLLEELTGPVVIRRLERVGVVAPFGAPNPELEAVGERRP